MNCDEAKRKLYVFLDNELSVNETVNILHHLEHCKFCFNNFEQEKTFQKVIKLRSEAEQAPEHFKDNLLKALDQFDERWEHDSDQGNNKFSISLKYYAIAAIIMIAIGLSLAPFINKPSHHATNQITAADITSALNATHTNNSDLILVGDDRSELPVRFKNNNKIHEHKSTMVCIPDFEDFDCTMEKAGIVTIGHCCEAAGMSFTSNGKTLTFLCFPLTDSPITNNDIINGKNVYTQNIDNVKMIIWSTKNCTHSFASSLPDEQLDAILSKVIH